MDEFELFKMFTVAFLIGCCCTYIMTAKTYCPETSLFRLVAEAAVVGFAWYVMLHFTVGTWVYYKY